VCNFNSCALLER